MIKKLFDLPARVGRFVKHYRDPTISVVIDVHVVDISDIPVSMTAPKTLFFDRGIIIHEVSREFKPQEPSDMYRLRFDPLKVLKRGTKKYARMRKNAVDHVPTVYTPLWMYKLYGWVDPRETWCMVGKDAHDATWIHELAHMAGCWHTSTPGNILSPADGPVRTQITRFQAAVIKSAWFSLEAKDLTSSVDNIYKSPE
jgi:hypothetical protein